MTERVFILKSTSVAGLLEQERELLAENSRMKPLAVKYFLSNARQCAGGIEDAAVRLAPAAVSFIVQPPLGGYAIAAFYHLAGDAEVRASACGCVLSSGGVEQFFTAGIVSSAPSSASQTEAVLKAYDAMLAAGNMVMEANCVRTWFYVDDIDRNYAGMVRARREDFEKKGMCPQTHYIASTGIQGAPVPENCVVQLDALAMRGAFTQRYLHAPTHMNPTHEYGVTFERGVRLEYDGQAKILISGTASINNRGEVVHVGDAAAQARRMLENVSVLLEEGGAGWKDLSHAIVYLRNSSDYAEVAPVVDPYCARIPVVYLLAPVCRPDWLVEMECWATVKC